MIYFSSLDAYRSSSDDMESVQGAELALRQAKTVSFLRKFLRHNEHAACISEANTDDSSFLLDASYFRPATIFEADSSRGFAAILV